MWSSLMCSVVKLELITRCRPIGLTNTFGVEAGSRSWVFEGDLESLCVFLTWIADTMGIKVTLPDIEFLHKWRTAPVEISAKHVTQSPSPAGADCHRHTAIGGRR